MTNKHGLSRNIPAAVKFQVRRECWYGCVICGNSIIEYEHVDPSFAEARSHDPASIALLCNHHHAEVTRKFRSKDSVSAARRDPYCKKSGFSWGDFDLSGNPIRLMIGGNIFIGPNAPILIGGRPLFVVEKSEEKGAPFRLSMDFWNNDSDLVFQIERNEWKSFIGNWDVEFTAGKIIVTDEQKNIVFSLKIIPPNDIILDSLRMQIRGVSIYATNAGLFMNGERTGQAYMAFNSFENAGPLISID